MKSTSYLRIILYVLAAFILFEVAVDSGDQSSLQAFPILWLVLLVILVFGFSLEMILASINKMMYRTLSEEQRSNFEAEEALRQAKKFVKLKAWYHRMLDSKPMVQEDTILMDHNYDGIQELDNNLPPWWKYLFYITIVFGVGYMLYYHVFDGPTQEMEYDKAISDAAIAVAAYKIENPDLVDASSVVILTEASDLKAGSQIFADMCAVCHRADGAGGIGPNLTDDYWILGGDIASIYTTVSEGGRPGKGMVPWKGELSPSEMAQVSSFITTLVGTDPADAKAPEGDLYVVEE